MGLQFYPLYWVYHDFWDYSESSFVTSASGIHTTKSTYHHYGHMHFFMPGFYTQQVGRQQAYTGQQTFSFTLEQLWGPNSKDVNQQLNFKIVGKPKWYFYIEEYWKRIYIQDWDYKTNDRDSKGFLGKKGIKYDASLPQHTRGIFRQTKDNYFFYSDLCRTLPIQYWKNQNKTVRDHYLRLNNGSPQYEFFYKVQGSENWKRSYSDIIKPTWDFSNDYPKLIDKNIPPKYDPQNGYIDYTDFYTHYDEFTIPRKFQCDGDPNYPRDAIDTATKYIQADQRYRSFCDQSGARVSSYPDRYYIYPTIEYQKVIHKNWQRLDGWEQRDVQDQESGWVFGDGYSQSVSIPYQTQVNGQLRTMSPFSDDNGKVYGAGIYQHNVVKEQDKLKVNLEFAENGQVLFNNYEMQLLYKKPRSTWSRPMIQQLEDYNKDSRTQNLKFHCPAVYTPYLDGMWVQQCLGAIVKAKVKVITEDNYGGRRENWVETTHDVFESPFIGKQQPDSAKNSVKI